MGELPRKVLEAMQEAVPIEFSVVGDDDTVLAWNKHETRIFKRPPAVVGRNVKNCHPKKSLDKVETILSEMKAGKRDNAKFRIDLPIGEDGRNLSRFSTSFRRISPESGYFSAKGTFSADSVERTLGQKICADRGIYEQDCCARLPSLRYRSCGVCPTI